MNLHFLRLPHIGIQKHPDKWRGNYKVQLPPELSFEPHKLHRWSSSEGEGADVCLLALHLFYMAADHLHSTGSLRGIGNTWWLFFFFEKNQLICVSINTQEQKDNKAF